jgi:hypothetical protein
MSECSSKNLYSSLGWCAGKASTPGIRKRTYVIPKRSILKWPDRTTEPDPKNPGETQKLKGNFTLVADQYFKYLEVVPKSSKGTSESQGEYPCKSFLNKLQLFYPGTDDEVEEFCTQANNDDLVYLVQEQTGVFKVYGCEEYETNTTSSGDTGSGPTDAKGETINVEVTMPTKPLSYSGAIMVAADEDANATA